LSSDEPDHYATLGLDRHCTTAQVRAAYRRLAKRHHPDANPGVPEAADRTQAINAAHEILSDPARRRAYGRDRDPGPSGPAFRGKIERNISQDVRLRLRDFLRGVSLEVQVNDPGNPSGPESYTLDVPADTAPGARFNLPRHPPFEQGLVRLRLRALPDYRFKVRGSDLRCDLRINARIAASGGTETVAGVMGNMVRVPIPPAIKRGEVIRVAGEGMSRPRGGRGDLLVRITYRPEVRVSRGS
jgi:DnaJ-class molecular chaperone